MIEGQKTLRLELLDIEARDFGREIVVEAVVGVCWDGYFVLTGDSR